MKTALITGTSSGIGLATAQVFLEHGWTVHGISRGPTPIENENFHPIALDLTRTEPLADAIEHIPEIHALIHNAGITEDGSGNGPAVLATGPQALYRLLKAVDARLIAARGALVSVSSYAAGRTEYGVYGEAKANIEALTLRYGIANAPAGVRANIVRPHYITETRNWPVPMDATRETIPLRRYGMPREVGTLIYELASNPMITGATVPIDGGVTLLERGVS